MSKTQNALNPIALDIKQMIDTSRQNVAIAVNSEITLLYWKIGKRINEEVLGNERAEYGKQVVVMLAQQLEIEYGTSFSDKNLRRMMQFASVFTDFQIVVSAIRQLSWTHFIALIPLKDALQREFYIEMCKVERWNVKTLREKIDGMLFERTAISKKPDELIEKELRELREENKVTPDLVFRSPLFLDFLGLKDKYNEKNLEDAVLSELEYFILELGQGFSFIERQKSMVIDGEDFKLDLLFYHRKLRRLVAID
jgi:predicted nuclease of restriction endonuclease-like (RecB) superfamily